MKSSIFKSLSNSSVAYSEPILNNRYVVEFSGGGINIEPFLIQSINLPKFSNGEWEELTMEILNLIDCSTIIELNKIINQFNSKFKIQIKILDPVQHITGTWDIDCKITSIDFGDFKYDLEDEKSELLISKVKFKILDCKFKI